MEGGMSNLNQFYGNVLSRTPTSIIASDLTDAVSLTGLTNAASRMAVGVRAVLSGAMTADTWKETLSVTGAGVLNFASTQTQNATSRNVGIRITLDGAVVISRTSTAVVTTNGIVLAVGSMVSTDNLNDFKFEDIPFNVSMKIEILSSVTETDKLLTAYKYRTC